MVVVTVEIIHSGALSWNDYTEFLRSDHERKVDHVYVYN